GVMYTPQSRPGLTVEQLFNERLVLVSTKPKAAPEPMHDYVYVDWGPEFYSKHKAVFPNYSGTSLAVNIGWLGLQHVLHKGGSGYFPLRIVSPHLKARQLTIINKAPEFAITAYVIYPTEHTKDTFRNAIEIMHSIAASITSGRSSSQYLKRRFSA